MLHLDTFVAILLSIS